MKILNQKNMKASTTIMSYERALGLGKIDGSASVTKFGRVVVATTEVLISEGGVYGMPVTAENVVTTSLSVEDAPAGLGARSIGLLGIDENDLLAWEIKAIDVPSVNKYKRVFRCDIPKSGTVSPTGVNANLGVITVTQDTSLIDMVKIPLNQGQTQTACMTIPKGYTGLVSYADAVSGEGKTCNVKFKVRPNYLDPESPFLNKGERDTFQNQVGRIFTTPQEVKEFSDIVFTGISNANGAVTSAVMVVELIENAKSGLA